MNWLATADKFQIEENAFENAEFWQSFCEEFAEYYTEGTDYFEQLQEFEEHHWSRRREHRQLQEMAAAAAAAKLGKIGGSVTGGKKAVAVRENGKKGGAPRLPRHSVIVFRLGDGWVLNDNGHTEQLPYYCKTKAAVRKFLKTRLENLDARAVLAIKWA